MGCIEQGQSLPTGTVEHSKFVIGGPPESQGECLRECRDVACCGPDGTCVETVESFCEPYTAGYREGLYPSPPEGGPYATVAPCDSFSCPTCVSVTKGVSWQSDVIVEVNFVNSYVSNQGATITVGVRNESQGTSPYQTISAALYLDSSKQGWLSLARMEPAAGALVGAHPAYWSDGVMPTEPNASTFSGFRAGATFSDAIFDCNPSFFWQFPSHPYAGETWGIFGQQFQITPENQILYYYRRARFAVKVGHLVISSASNVANGSYLVGTHDIYLHGSIASTGYFVEKTFATTQTFSGTAGVSFRRELPASLPQNQRDTFFVSPLIFGSSPTSTVDVRMQLLPTANPLP